MNQRLHISKLIVCALLVSSSAQLVHASTKKPASLKPAASKNVVKYTGPGSKTEFYVDTASKKALIDPRVALRQAAEAYKKSQTLENAQDLHIKFLAVYPQTTATRLAKEVYPAFNIDTIRAAVLKGIGDRGGSIRDLESKLAVAGSTLATLRSQLVSFKSKYGTTSAQVLALKDQLDAALSKQKSLEGELAARIASAKSVDDAYNQLLAQSSFEAAAGFLSGLTDMKFKGDVLAKDKATIVGKFEALCKAAASVSKEDADRVNAFIGEPNRFSEKKASPASVPVVGSEDEGEGEEEGVLGGLFTERDESAGQGSYDVSDGEDEQEVLADNVPPKRPSEGQKRPEINAEQPKPESGGQGQGGGQQQQGGGGAKGDQAIAPILQAIKAATTESALRNEIGKITENMSEQNKSTLRDAAKAKAKKVVQDENALAVLITDINNAGESADF